MQELENEHHEVEEIVAKERRIMVQRVNNCAVQKPRWGRGDLKRKKTGDITRIFKESFKAGRVNRLHLQDKSSCAYIEFSTCHAAIKAFRTPRELPPNDCNIRT